MRGVVAIDDVKKPPSLAAFSRVYCGTVAGYASRSTSLWLMAKRASSRRVLTPVLSKTLEQVALHGFFGDGELLGNVLVRAALDDAGDDFELARGETVGLALGLGGCFLHEVVKSAEEVDDALAADPVVAGEDGAQGLGEIAGDGVLEDDAAGADLKSFNDLLGGDGGGEQDDLNARRTRHDGAHGFQAGKLGHGEIEQKDVGLELEDLSDGGVAIAGFRDDLEAGFGLKHVFDTETDDGVIIGDDDADVAANARKWTLEFGGGGGRGHGLCGGDRHRFETLQRTDNCETSIGTSWLRAGVTKVCYENRADRILRRRSEADRKSVTAGEPLKTEASAVSAMDAR